LSILSLSSFDNTAAVLCVWYLGMISIQLLLEVTFFSDAIFDLMVGILIEVLVCVCVIVLLCLVPQHNTVKCFKVGKDKQKIKQITEHYNKVKNLN
jgi:hypothetical protein